jgi:hypothetical protein
MYSMYGKAGNPKSARPDGWVVGKVKYEEVKRERERKHSSTTEERVETSKGRRMQQQRLSRHSQGDRKPPIQTGLDGPIEGLAEEQPQQLFASPDAHSSAPTVAVSGNEDSHDSGKFQLFPRPGKKLVSGCIL